MSKLTRKLCGYFATVLLSFSLLVGITFQHFFTDHSVSLYREQMEEQAIEVADTMAGFLDRSHQTVENQSGTGYGLYMKSLALVPQWEIWILDENMDFLSRGHKGINLKYDDFPPKAKEMVEQVMKGESLFSEEFSPLGSDYNFAEITVAVPIWNSKNVVEGAVLIHSSLDNLEKSTQMGTNFLFYSMLLAFLFVFALSIFLSKLFITPIERMKNMAVSLEQGDYSVKSNLKGTDELGELGNCLDSLVITLQKSSEEQKRLAVLREEFLANVSHELRTPVTVIRGSIEALVDGIITEPQRVSDYHREILHEIVFLQRLVNDLLDLSKLKSLDFPFEVQEINLQDLLQDVVRSANHLAQDKEIVIQQKYSGENRLIQGDYGRLRQMFLIVLHNAIKFTPTGGEVYVSEDNSVVEVTDYGTGISQEDLPHIFDRFYKSSDENNKTGTGLGLPIAKAIANRSNITIKATSDNCTTFRFIFNQ